MVERLRRRFIAIAMLSVFVVLILVVGAIDINAYHRMDKNMTAIMTIINEHDGAIPTVDDKEEYFEYQRRLFDNSFKISPDTRFETRFFSAEIKDGNVIKINTEHTAAITAKAAKEIVLEFYATNNTSGYYRDFRYKSFVENGVTTYIFLDSGREIQAFRNFLFASVGCSAGGMVLVFVLVLFFSNLIIKPVLRSLEQQKQFITDASHEIKTPLTIISANATVIEMMNGESEWTTSIKNQINRLTSLTEKLIMLAKAEEKVTQEYTIFSMTDAIEEVVETFVPVAKTRNKNLVTNIEQNVTLNGEEPALKRVVSLLLDNAIKYSDEGGKIEVTLTSGKNKCIKVSNTTEGIKKGSHYEYFARFYRDDKSRNSKTGGHGIGLSVARAIALSHNAKIKAYSPDGKIFTVEIII